MSRHRFCMINDRDGFIEELAEELWTERRREGEPLSWADADPGVKQAIRKRAAETLRILEHGHG